MINLYYTIVDNIEIIQPLDSEIGFFHHLPKVSSTTVPIYTRKNGVTRIYCPVPVINEGDRKYYYLVRASNCSKKMRQRIISSLRWGRVENRYSDNPEQDLGYQAAIRVAGSLQSTNGRFQSFMYDIKDISRHGEMRNLIPILGRIIPSHNEMYPLRMRESNFTKISKIESWMNPNIEYYLFKNDGLYLGFNGLTGKIINAVKDGRDKGENMIKQNDNADAIKTSITDAKELFSSLMPSEILAMDRSKLNDLWDKKLSPFVKKMTAVVENNSGKIVAGAAFTFIMTEVVKAVVDAYAIKFKHISEAVYNKHILRKEGLLTDSDNLQKDAFLSDISTRMGESTALIGVRYIDIPMHQDSVELTATSNLVTFGEIDKLVTRFNKATQILIQNGYENIVRKLVRSGAKYEDKLVDLEEDESWLDKVKDLASLSFILPASAVTVNDLVCLEFAASKIA